MCFSATASLSAATGLTVTGIVGIFFATQSNPRFIPINLMSFFFAIQQFAEGMNWLGPPVFTANFWGGLFLFFAFFVYPWYIGFSCHQLTANRLRKKWIKVITILGFIYGAILFLSTILLPGFEASATCCQHIQYNFWLSTHFPIGFYTVIALYILLTALPTFITDRRDALWLGIAIVLSALICGIIYLEYFISVWCFYAAVIAFTIAIITCIQWWRFVSRMY